MSLTGKKIKDSYKDLLIVDNNNAGVDGTMRTISDGEGTASALQVSEVGVQVNGDLNVTGNATGIEGSTFKYQGDWVTGEYQKNDVVSHETGSFVAKTDIEDFSSISGNGSGYIPSGILDDHNKNINTSR